MKLNVAPTRPAITTHEGARARFEKPVEQLRRSVMSCLLWEKEFYEDGEAIAARITRLVHEVGGYEAMQIAKEARQDFNLRHVPLLITVACMSTKGPKLVSPYDIAGVIERADELAEIVAIYWKDGRKPLPAVMKHGLRLAFQKFNAYHLAKYNREGTVRLRDVMFLVHPKPKDDEQALAFKQLADDTLPAPDTWEVALSAGEDKAATFTRLIEEGKLGYLALLRNLRNMEAAGVESSVIKNAIRARKGASRVLPFRYVAAARAVPQYEAVLDEAMLSSLGDTVPGLRGNTVVLVDVSGSMGAALSGKSDLKRYEAAAALAGIVRCESHRIFTFSDYFVEVPPRRGMACIDAIVHSQFSNGTQMGAAVAEANKIGYDRIIVITDEQSQDVVPQPVGKHNYIINVASSLNGVAADGRWVKIHGFSENVLRYIHELESCSHS